MQPQSTGPSGLQASWQHCAVQCDCMIGTTEVELKKVGLHLFPGLPNELGYGLLVVLLHGEVGGDGRVIPTQQPNGSSVICSSCSLFRVIVSHRNPALAKGSHLSTACTSCSTGPPSP